jgi:hypothetical protein
MDLLAPIASRFPTIVMTLAISFQGRFAVETLSEVVCGSISTHHPGEPPILPPRTYSDRSAFTIDNPILSIVIDQERFLDSPNATTSGTFGVSSRPPAERPSKAVVAPEDVLFRIGISPSGGLTPKQEMCQGLSKPLNSNALALLYFGSTCLIRADPSP